MLLLMNVERKKMSEYHIQGLADDVTDEVRRTMRSPEYGHPAILEVAKGTGPCRACLEPFRAGEDERLLFTYRPEGGNGTIGAPGPVFIHARSCTQYRGSTFPAALHAFPVIIEARAGDNRVPVAHAGTGADADAILTRLFTDSDVDFVHVRHGEAGCHMLRVDRGPLP
jgi:hypothetical protein